MTEAILYEKLSGTRVRCYLCAHGCVIGEGHFGICGVRQNQGGLLRTLVYGMPVALHADPVEKKPLYHFLPGARSFSLATIGCNFRCGFCQNWQISQARLEGGVFPGEPIPPEAIVARAQKERCATIAYTYTEPTIFFEYARDIGRLAHEEGLKNIFVTNGFLSRECRQEAYGWLDAANVDLKFFSDEAYRRVCGARLEPVLETIRELKAHGVWVEVTTLLVPGENDAQEDLAAMARFIAGVDRDMPWHLSRFFPDFEYGDRPATPEQTVKRALALAQEAGVRYVYAGNVTGWGGDTVCPACRSTLIRRDGFQVKENKIVAGRCGCCAAAVPGIFKSTVSEGA